MQVTVRYFAIVREITGQESETRDVADGTSAGELLDEVARDFPAVGRLRASSMLMVNQEYAPAEQRLRDGDEVALIPPVAGGETLFNVTDEPIDLAAVAASVAHDGAGAVVTFSGTVRDNARGRTVRLLEYEAYPEAAEKMLARIGDEIAERWEVNGVAITHRVGRLQVGEASVAIAVSSPHRAEAFDACRYAIERIKQIVPIWKKEFYGDGETWIGSEAEYQAAFGYSSRGTGSGASGSSR
jgi:molybdopterin synthase catalytic subunit